MGQMMINPLNMKKIVLFILIMLPVAVFGQNTTGLIMFDTPGDVLAIRSFKVSRSMDEGFAIANGLSDRKFNSYYGLTVLLNQEGKYFCDDEIVNVPADKEARIVGVYKYRDEDRTVPVIQFYKVSPSAMVVTTDAIGDTEVYDVVEQMPQFPGGPSALFDYLANSIKYPVAAEDAKLQGRVIVTFTVERDGSITDVRVAHSSGESLDEEALRVVKSMPRWIPGRQKGKAVRVQYTVPVTFRLQ